MKRSSLRLFVSILSFSLLQGTVGAVDYPTTTPAGEQTGGWFQTYFTNIFSSETACYGVGKVVAGFENDGTPICQLPSAATSLSMLGQTLGDTLRFDGTDWIRTNFLYNNGTQVGINTQAPGATLDVSGTIKISGGSPGSGKVLTSDATGLASWQSPTSSTSWELLGNSGTTVGTHFLGTTDDVSLMFKVNSTKAGFLGNSADNNTFFGRSAGSASDANLSSLAMGVNALFSNITGLYNTAIGYGSLYSDTLGSNNTANGYSALFLSTGESNTALGYNAGSTLTSGDNNIFIGAGTQPNIATTGSDQLNIGNWIFGNSGSIGIGVANPGAKLDIAGTIKITDGSQGSGKILVSDVNGLATWIGTGSLGITASGFTIGGSTLGSTLYYDGSNWVASENIYNAGGNVGIGSSVPGAKLDVNGTIKISGGSPGVGKVLTSDATGLASWQTPTASTAYATGILSLASSGGYITKFMAGGSGITSSLLYETGGKVAIGTINPTYMFDVQGSGSIIRAGSGFCLGMTASGCVDDWTDLNNVVKSMGTPHYLAKFNSGGLIDNSQIYETGGKLYIGDIADIISGGATVGYVTIETFGSTNSSNPFLTLSENGGQECRLWITGANKLGSNCTWTAGLGGSYEPNQVIKADSAGTDLTGSIIYESSGNVGIGKTVPGYKLDVTGTGAFWGVRISSGATSGYVLTSDASGNGRWAIESDPEVGSNTTNYLSKWNGSALVTSRVYDNGTYVGIGTSTPSANLYVSGTALVTGNLTVQGNLIVDKIVNRTVNNVSISGSLLPDSAAPLAYRDIGSGSLRWNNMYLSGQVTIGGGSPGAGKFLVSDATGLASWTGLVTATSLNLAGATLGNTLYFDGTNWVASNNIYNTGGNVGIGITGTAPVPTSKFEVWSGGTVQSLLHFRGTNNVGLGLNTVRYLTTGTANTGFGNDVLRTLSTGYSNSAFGHSAMYNNMQGYFNTAGGTQALYTNSNGNWNIALGSQALYTNNGGSYNVGIGGQALYLNSGGNGNTAVGDNALRSTTASNNTAIGYGAGSGVTTGSNNIAIGAGVQVYNNGASNQLNIGNWIYGSGGNIGIGQSNPATKLDINGTIKITGGSPGLGKVLTSDASGLASWSSALSGATATGITGGTANYVSKFGTGGNGLYASQIFDNGTHVGIGTGTNLTARLNIDSGTNNVAGLRLPRINNSSTAYTGAAIGLGVDANGNVVPVSNGDVVVYDALDRTTPPTPDPNVASRTISYDFNNYFDIPTKQSFVVSTGDSSSFNGPFIRSNGTSPVCSWNGTFGTSPYNCQTDTDEFGVSASPWNSFTMTAKGDTFGYQLALGARGDAPLFARSGRFNGAVGGGLYTNDSPFQTPAPWQKVLTIPANHTEYFYINTGYNSQLQAQANGGRIGIGTTSPNYSLDIRGEVGMMNRVYLTGTTASAGSPTLSFDGDTNMGIFRPAADTLAVSTAGTERMRIFSNGNVSIGSTTNSAKLRVEGQVMITGGTPGVGKVLTSDASGLATWQTPSGGGGGTTILQATVNKNLPSISNNNCYLETFNVPGAVTGKTAWISPASDLGSSTNTTLFIASVRVSAADTVEVKFCNEAGSAVDRPAMNFYVSVIQ